MIQGIGIDIVEIARIEEKIKSNPHFVHHVFSAKEIDYCEGKKKAAMHYAGKWAAKEAYLKAYGLQFIGNHKLHEIEILQAENGNPYIHLQGKSAINHQEKGLGIIHLSISHTDIVATAYVIIESI